MDDRLGLLADPAVRSAVAGELGRPIELHARIASTQERGRAIADAGGEAIVVADEQTAGRGRQGRTWLAPAGTALLASWIFRPLPADPALCALLAGVAVARALDQLGAGGSGLRWPNDVLLAGKKVAGVLADAVSDGDGGALVVGIGVNVSQSVADLGDLAGAATSCALAGHAVDRLALLARLDRELRALVSEPSVRPARLEEWRRRSATLGHEVEVRSMDGASLRGVARDVADDGSLLLVTSAGERRVLAGDVRLL